MSEKEITTAAIADFVKAHSPIAAPAVGKHFGKPCWTGDIERAAKPLFDAGHIQIDSERGVVWVEIPKSKRIETQQSDSDALKGKPLTDENKAVTGESESHFPSADGENGQIDTDDPFPAVPEELKALRQWVMWVYKTREGKTTKVPRQVNGENNAATDTPQTWNTFASVVEHEHKQKGRHRIFAGIGFVFSPNDPYCGIDLDDCIDEKGNIKPWAKTIVDRLKLVAYGEVSPSRKGIKFWTRGKLPPNIKHKGYIVKGADAIEAYDSGRFFTVTGNGKGVIGDGQSAINWLVKQHLTPDHNPSTNSPPVTDSRTPDQIIDLIRKSTQVYKFDALMAGDTTGYGSQSEADIGLCSVIAFWTQDPSTIDAIFRQSNLMRPKWDEPHYSGGTTYGQKTIERSLSGNRETYQHKTTTYAQRKMEDKLCQIRQLQEKSLL